MDLPRPEPVLADAAKRPAAGDEPAPRPVRFPPEQRRVLLLQTGVGEGVLRRLEAAGYASIETLQAGGLQQVIDEVCDHHSLGAIRNRCRALERAVAAWTERCAALADGVPGTARSAPR